MMAPVDDIIIMLSKQRFGIELFPDEQDALEAWLKQSDNHQAFFELLTNDGNWGKTFPEDSPKDRKATIERIRRALYAMSGLTVSRQVKPEQPRISNGSANAFDATENPVQYEKDIRDEDIDELV